jgi:hypothetical protein
MMREQEGGMIHFENGEKNHEPSFRKKCPLKTQKGKDIYSPPNPSEKHTS